jgi:phosphate transport system protein
MDITSHTHHISQQYNIELDDIRKHLSEMGGMAQRQVNDAITALVDADTTKAEQVVRADKTVNSMEVSIDEECIRILARRQPAASDLRLVIAVTKAITDLERIGDEASKIARQAIAMSSGRYGAARLCGSASYWWFGIAYVAGFTRCLCPLGYRNG